MNRVAGPGGSVFRTTRGAEAYDADRFGGPFGRQLEEEEAGLFARLLGDAPLDVLDAGAGTGKLSLALRARGHAVTSADFSKAMARVGQAKAGAAGQPRRYVVADIQALCFPDRAFSATVCSRVLMHVAAWREAIAELCRVTRGVVVVDFPPRFAAAGLDELRKRLFPGAFPDFRRPYRTFSLRVVRAELERHAFAVVEVRRACVLPLAFHRWLERPTLSRRLEGVLAALGLRRWLGAPVTVKAVRRP